jgi:hypothetical protein
VDQGLHYKAALLMMEMVVAVAVVVVVITVAAQGQILTLVQEVVAGLGLLILYL